MTPIDRLIALRREHLIRAAGLATEIAMAQGNRSDTEFNQRVMYELIGQRQAAIEAAEAAGASYFDAAGEIDALRVLAASAVKKEGTRDAQ